MSRISLALSALFLLAVAGATATGQLPPEVALALLTALGLPSPLAALKGWRRPARPGDLALAVLLLTSACSPALRGSLLACAAAEVAPAVSAATDLALHQGEGWQEQLAKLVLSYGECAVRAAVRAVADRPVEPAAAALVALPDAPVTAEEAQRRARDWLRGRQ